MKKSEYCYSLFCFWRYLFGEEKKCCFRDFNQGGNGAFPLGTPILYLCNNELSDFFS
jgi:ligand-binding sensor protein